MTGLDPSYAEKVQLGQKLCNAVFEKIDRGDEYDLELLRGLPGVALEPTSWDRMRQIIAAPTPEGLGTMGRHPLELKRYKHHRAAQAHQYASVTDSLLIKIFGVTSRYNEEGKMVAVLPDDFHSSLKVVWVKNEFPYWFAAGVEHHNVWANRPLTPEELQQFVHSQREGYEFVHYINPPELMTVPKIWHAHVISRRAAKSS